MRYRVTHTTKYSYSEHVPVCHNKVHLAPRATPRQACVQHRLTIHPEPARIDSHTDYFGNHVEYFSIQDPSRSLAVTATSLVDVSAGDAAAAAVPREVEDAPPWDEIRHRLAVPSSDDEHAASLYAYRSELVAPSSAFADYAAPSFSPGRPIVAACRELMSRIFEEFKYDPRATNVSTPVEEVLEKKAGVCQDFAHLQITCLRSLGLAARYVSGYLRTEPPADRPRLVGADASHAWLAVFCGERGWIELDPTNNIVPATDHVTVAYGRDYSDVCPIQGVFVGGGDHSMSVSVDVLPV